MNSIQQNTIIKPSKPFIPNKKGLALAYINSNVVLTQEETNTYNRLKERKRNKRIIISASIAAGLGVLGLGAGIPRFKELLNRGIIVLNRKARNLAKNEDKLIVNKFLRTVAITLVKVFEKIKAIGNLVPMKDIGIGKLLDKTIVGKRFAKGTTSFFKEKTLNVTKGEDEIILNLFDFFKRRNNKILQYLKEHPEKDILITDKKIQTSKYIKMKMKLLEEATEQYANLYEKYRATEIPKITAKAKDEAIIKIKNREFKTNIADEVLKNEKLHIIKELNAIKDKITNDTSHKVKLIYKDIAEINSFLKSGSKKERKILGRIKDLCKYYKKPKNYTNDKNIKTNLNKVLNSQEKETQRAIIQEEISANIKKLEVLLQKQPKEQGLIDAFDRLKELSTKMKKKGLVEEISMASKVFPPDKSYMYKDFKKMRDVFKKRMRRSINKITRLFDKYRDLNIGSAPTDIIGQLPALAIVSYNISTGKNRKERVSSTFKGGIPVVGGIGTILLATLKQVNSFGSVLLGLGVGIILNKVGAKVVKAIYPPIVQHPDSAKK